MSRVARFGVIAAFVALFPTGSARAAEPDKLLPADAEFVLSVNFKQIVESDIIKKYALEQAKQALEGADTKKFLTDLGLDPLKDIHRLVIGGSGKDATDGKALIVAHGKFDPLKLFKAAEAQTKRDPDHFSLINDGKDKLFKYTPDNGNPIYGTVLDENTIVAGTSKKIVTTALAVTGSKSAISKELAALIRKMDNKASLWVVAITKGKLDGAKIPKGGAVPEELEGQIKKMESVAIVIRVTEDVALDITAGMPSMDLAEGLTKSLDGLLQQAKGALPFLAAMRPELKPVVEVARSLKCVANDKNVVLTAKAAGSAVGDLLKLVGN